MQNIIKEELIIEDDQEYNGFEDFGYDDDFDSNCIAKRIKLEDEKINYDVDYKKHTRQQNFYTKEEPVIIDCESTDQIVPPTKALPTEPTDPPKPAKTHTYCSGCSRKSAVRVRKALCLDCNGPLSYHCDSCGTSYKTYTNLNYHVRTHHVPESRVFRCQSCSKQMLTAKILSNHQRYCGKPKLFGCKHCDCTFKYKKSLKDHVESSHTVKKFKCEKCGKTYGNCKSLKRHMTLYCDGKKAFSCEHCSFRAFRKDQMPTHLRQNHRHIFKRSQRAKGNESEDKV